MRRLAWFVVVAFAGAGCDPRLYAHESQRAEPAAIEEPSPTPMGPLAALGALGRAREPGPFDEPLQSDGYVDGKPYVAVLDITGHVVELDPPLSLSLSQLSGQDLIVLRTLLLRLATLQADPQVSAILLRFRGFSIGLAAAEELQRELAAPKKPIFCHAEQLDNTTALVLSACSRVGLAAGGTVSLTGPALIPIYLKGLLDLINVQIDVVHIGSFKGAAEPLTRTEPSPEMRQTYDDLLNGAYATLVGALAAGRHTKPDTVERWIDHALFDANAAEAASIVDEVGVFETFRASVTSFGAEQDGARRPWKRVKLAGQERGDLFAVLGLKPKKRVSGPHIAVIYAVGQVVDGRGSAGGAFEEVASGRLAPALRAAANDDEVEAIVLRVDSPGGSALASEIIWSAANEAAAKKPLVVSMGAVAASGGYYIATGARRIFALPDTLTGSIGVIGGKLVLGDALAKIGVTATELGRGKRSLIHSPLRPWNDEERDAIRAEMETTYRLFKERVAAGRKLAPALVEEHAQGRVFTGAEALKRGLVDELGGLEAALAWTRKAAKLPEDTPIEIYPGELSLLDFIGGLGGVRASGLFTPALAQAVQLVDPVIAHSLEALLLRASAFRDHTVQTVAFLPAVR